VILVAQVALIVPLGGKLHAGELLEGMVERSILPPGALSPNGPGKGQLENTVCVSKKYSLPSI
jgi:hypothetical protein